MRHFISLLEYSTEELIAILDRADFLANAWRENSMPKSLRVKKWDYGFGETDSVIGWHLK